jgi:hypothetical protein
VLVTALGEAGGGGVHCADLEAALVLALAHVQPLRVLHQRAQLPPLAAPEVARAQHSMEILPFCLRNTRIFAYFMLLEKYYRNTSKFVYI